MERSAVHPDVYSAGYIGDGGGWVPGGHSEWAVDLRWIAITGAKRQGIQLMSTGVVAEIAGCN